jgi:nucleotide-binding universal stress UspA family protein
MRKVVIPLEVSEISNEILPVVRRLFGPHEVELTLLAVVQPQELPVVITDAHMMALPPSACVTTLKDEEWNSYRKRIHDRLYKAALALRVAGYTVATVLLTGDTVTEIANYVERRNFDLVAMATYGRKGINRLLYGSIAEQLLRQVSAPMLLYRHQPEPTSEEGERVKWAGVQHAYRLPTTMASAK